MNFLEFFFLNSDERISFCCRDIFVFAQFSGNAYFEQFILGIDVCHVHSTGYSCVCWRKLLKSVSGTRCFIMHWINWSVSVNIRGKNVPLLFTITDMYPIRENSGNSKWTLESAFILRQIQLGKCFNVTESCIQKPEYERPIYRE